MTAVKTGLTPGQETRPGYLPLTDFINEAEAEHCFEHAVAALNPMA